MLIFYVLAKVVEISLSVITAAMIVRMILSWFVNPAESKVYLFCSTISEPFILPFRYIFNKLNIAQNIPLDLPFMAAYLVMLFLRMLLPVLY